MLRGEMTMVNAILVKSWICEECGRDYDHKYEAESCCKKKSQLGYKKRR